MVPAKERRLLLLMKHNDVTSRVRELKQKRHAVILAHNYQMPEVQDIADFVGDSLELSQIAQSVDAEVIVFCGVHFMAESAAVLSPTKTILLPVLEAGCPMADMVTADALREKKKEHPGVPVVCYVNTSAEVKAESDVCCTSANAVSVVNALDEDEVIFVPDCNLGSYVQRMTNKKVLLWEGYCITHHRVSSADVHKALEAHPDAIVVVHPECRPEVVEMADYVASTSGIIELCSSLDAEKFIIGTEMGLLHRLKKRNPNKQFYLLSPGMVCPNMKATRLEDVERALVDMNHVITVDETIASRARLALDRMVEIV
jgi:quinolinate synthase